MKKLFTSGVFFFALHLSFAQIPNAGFELWDNQPVLLQWQTNSRPLTLPPWDPYIIKRDTDSYSGNFAANFYANGILKPFATTTFPIFIHPQNLTLYYKLSFAPCVNSIGYPQQDTASVLVEILNGNTVVDSGYWESITTNFNYSQLVIPISQNAAVFDSCRISIWGGKVIGGCGIIAAATQFKVDQAELKYSNQTGCVDSSRICDSCICPLIYDPVCGCNGVTYVNYCYANSAGVTSWTMGACASDTAGMCQAGFNFQKHIDSVQFNDISTADSITNYQWDFGDGNFSSDQYPLHVFAHDSTYIVCLSITGIDSAGNTCTNQFCDSVLITHNCIDSTLLCHFPLCCDIVPPIPVCGCDSITYANACEAKNFYGVSSYYIGNCVTTGINDISSIEAGIWLSPNPAKDLIQVSYITGHSGYTEIRIKNMLGQEVKLFSSTFEISGMHKKAITINDLPDGIYLLEINIEGERRMKKFIKN